VGREKRSAHAARASLASPVSPATPSRFHKRKCHPCLYDIAWNGFFLTGRFLSSILWASSNRVPIIMWIGPTWSRGTERWAPPKSAGDCCLRYSSPPFRKGTRDQWKTLCKDMGKWLWAGCKLKTPFIQGEPSALFWLAQRAVPGSGKWLEIKNAYFYEPWVEVLRAGISRLHN
jgi:hypothetical protein